MKKARIAIMIIVLAAVAGGLYLVRVRMAARDTQALFVSGTIEVTEVQASFKQPARMASRPVDEGDSVTTGQVLAQLDLSDLVIEQATRSSEVWVARAVLDELEHGSRPDEIEQARAALVRAEADVVQLRAEYARQQNLVNQNLVSPSEYDKAKSAHEIGAARVREARAVLALLEQGPRIERIEQARAALARVTHQLDAAAQHVADAVLRAPFSGVVLSKNAEPGEYISAGTPVVALANMNEVWLRAYVSETDLGRIKLGQRASVTTDTYPDKQYQGRITFISSETEFTPKTVQTAKERVKLVYRIKITIPNPAWELKPGMPADARIMLD
ncbi:MAG: efflux RND transporter periplasmic adaptor subunit [bacterium]|nr:efflux RND transporter periplasmic adaptor subunit [bacterium]